MNIVTDYNPLCHRYHAWDDNDESVMGAGDTEESAIADLREQLDVTPAARRAGMGAV